MKNLIFAKIVLTLFVIPFFVNAANLDIRPFLIDEVVEPRQYLSEQVTLVNNKPHKVYVYATVNEITVDNEGEIKEFVSPIMTDRTNTATSWVEITRGRIELEPGESQTVDLGFRIHPSAEPGEYHMFIGFGSASKRHEVETAAMAGDLDGVLVKLTIEDESVEYLRIAGFQVERFVTNDESRKVQIELENLGDVDATPAGEIIFFTSNGEEMDAIEVNAESLIVPPGETVTITSEIPFSNQLGRFKANLALQYGEKQKASLYDTTQFFMMPLHIIILMLLVAVLLALLIFFLLHRALQYKEDHEEGIELPFMVKDGHDAEPKDHDIDLSKK